MTQGRRRITIAALALLAAIAAAIFWYTNVGASGGDGVVHIRSAGATHTFRVEIADTQPARSQGLMFRDHLDPDQGMLFDFFIEQPVSFWMQNTLIPLDMLFIRADGTIARIHDNAIPMDTTGIPSGAPVRFVLELAGGRAAELGIAEGDMLVHPRVQAAP